MNKTSETFRIKKFLITRDSTTCVSVLQNLTVSENPLSEISFTARRQPSVETVISEMGLPIPSQFL